MAIVGAGPGLGLSLARRFGREGLLVALLARDKERLEAHVDALRDDGVTATAHPADVLDRSALAVALADVEQAHGSVDVLAYNPTPGGATLRSPEDTTVDDALHQLQYSLLGGIAAVQAVLPGMLSRGDGALLFTGGYSALYPVPSHASAGLALAAQRNYAYALNRSLADRGVYAGTVTVAGLILRSSTGDEVLAAPPEQQAALTPLLIDPDDIANVYWDMVTKRDRVEEIVGKPSLVESTMH